MDGPRQRPSDGTSFLTYFSRFLIYFIIADTIERMLANLPAKRSRRSIISLSDVLFKTRKKKKAVSKKTANVKCGKKICNKPQLDSVKSTSNQQRSCRTLRSLNKVLSSRILDLNSSLLVKRKMKALRSQRLTKNMVLPKNCSSENSSVSENHEVSVAKEPKRQTTAKKLESDSVDNGVKPVKRMLASRLNLKNFFPVKKTNLKSLKKSTSLDEISSVNNQKSEDSSSSFLNLECYQNKKGGLKGFVRGLSLRKRVSKENDFLATVNTNNTPKDSRSSKSKVKQPAVIENVEAETDTKKRKFSLRKVIDKVKKLKSDKTVTKRIEETEKIKDQSFLVETSARKDGILSGKVVVPAEIKECSQRPEDLAPIAGSSTDSTENPPIPETIFNLENNEEKSMQAKGDVNFDVVENYSTKVEPLIVEPLSIKTETPLPLERKSEIDDKTSSDASLIKNKSIVSAVSPNPGTKGKIRKPSRGLNDCIAMLTSKLQQKDDKTSSMESLFSTSSITSVDPRPLTIPSEKPPSPEVIALDLSKKSSSTPDLKSIIKPASPLPDSPSTSTWTSVDNIIQKVIQDAAQMTENQRNKVDDTIDSVVNSSLTWFEDQLVETTDLNQLRKTQKKKKKRSDDSLITNIIFGKDKLIIAPSSNCEDPLIARIKKTQSLLNSAEQVSSVFVEPSPVTLEVSSVVGKVPKTRQRNKLPDLSTDVVYTESETSVANQQNVDCSDNLTPPAKLVPDPEDTLPLSTLRKEISKPETLINPETVPEDTLPTIDDLYPSIKSNNEESLETVNTDSLKENVEKPANGVKKVIKSVMKKKKRTGLVKRKRLAAKNTNIKALKTSESGSSPVEILPQIESKSAIFALIDLKDDPNLLKPETPLVHSTTLSLVTEQSPETNKDVKDSSTTQRTRRKSKSSRKIDQDDNDLFKNFALVINKKTKRIPPTSIVDDSVFDDLSLFSSTNNIETDKEVLNDSVEEMDMEIEDIPINTNIIERNNAMIASRELIHLPPIKAEVAKPSNQTLELDSSKKSDEVSILPAIQLYGNLNSEHTTRTTALSSPNDFHTPLEESTPIKPQNKKLKSKKKRQTADRKQKRTAHKETLLSEESSLSEPMVEVFTENDTKNIEGIQQDEVKEDLPPVESGSKVVDQIITVEDPRLNNEIPTEEAATESFVVKPTALMEDSGFVERLNEDSIDKKSVNSVLVGDTLEFDSKNDHRSFKLQSAEIIRDSPRKKSQSIPLPEDNKSNLSSGLKSKRARKLVNYNEDNFDSLLLNGLEQLNATNSKKSKRNESKALEGFVKNGATIFKASEFSEIPKLVVDIHHVDQIDPMLHNYLVKDATIELTSLDTFDDGCMKSNVLEEDASILTSKNEVENSVDVATSGVDEMEGELTNQPKVDETVSGEANMEKDSSILRRARKSKKNNKHNTSNESSVELNVLDTTTVQLSTQNAVENCNSSKKPLSELRRTRKSKKVNSDVKNGSNVGLNVLEEITTPTSNADQKLDTDLSAQGSDSVDEIEMQVTQTVLNYKTANCNELNRNIFGSYVEMKVLEELTPVPSIDDLNHKLKIEPVQISEPICDGSKSKRNKKSKKNISSDAVNSFNITIDVPEELQTTADDLNHKSDDESFPQDKLVTDDFNHGKECNDSSNDIRNGTNIGINVLEEITPTSTAGAPSEFLAQIVADKSEPILKRSKKSKKNLSYSESHAEDDLYQKPQTALQALVDDQVSVGKKLKRSKKKKNLKHKETGELTNIDVEIGRKVTSTSTVTDLDYNSLSLIEGERNRSKSELKHTKKLKNDISYSDIINGSNVDLNVLKTSIPTTEDLNQKAEVQIPLVAELVEDGKKASSFAKNSDLSELNCLETSTLSINQKPEIAALVAEENEVKSDSVFEHNSKLIKDISYNEVSSVEINAETTISSEVNENCRLDIQLQVEPAKKTDKTDLKRSKKSKKTVSNSGNVELNELKDDTLTWFEGCLNHKPEIELPVLVAKPAEEENSELNKKSKKNHYSIEMNSTIGSTPGYEELIQPVDVLNHKHDIELPTLDPEPENDKSDATILRPSRRSKKNVNYNEEELFNMAELNYNNTATQKKRKSICKSSQVECKDLSLADKLDVFPVQAPQCLEDAPALFCDTPQEKVDNSEHITNNNADFQIQEVNEVPHEYNNELECMDTTELDSCMLNKKRKNDRSSKKLKNNMDLDVANILEVEKRSTRRKKSLRDDNGDDVEDSQRFENETSSPLLQQINSLQNELAVDHFTGVKASSDFGDIGDISPQVTIEREEIDRDLFEKSSVVVREEPTNPVLIENREAELAKINIKNLLLSSLPSPRNLTDIPPEVVAPVENVISETKQKKKKSSNATDKKKKAIPNSKLTIATLKDVLSSFSESKTDSVFPELPPLTDIITSSEMDIAPVLDEIDKSLESEDIYDFSDDFYDETEESSIIKPIHKTNNSEEVTELKRRPSNRFAKLKALENIHEVALSDSQANMVLEENKRCKKKTKLDRVVQEQFSGAEIENHIPLIQIGVDTALSPQPLELQSSLEVEPTETTQQSDEAQELRRSRRGSRKVPSYNENDLIDPLIDALEKTRARGARKEKSLDKTESKVQSKAEDAPKLSSDELFDMLKKSSLENANTVTTKPLDAFADVFNQDSSNSASRGLTEGSSDNSDTVKAQYAEKIYEFTEDSPENTKIISDILGKNKKISINFHKAGDQDYVDLDKTLPVDNVQHEQPKQNYCDICKKSFIRLDSLVKHRATLTHISKLSELEAREAEEKAKLQKEVVEEQQKLENESLKAYISISDILQTASPSPRRLSKESPVLSSGLNLVDIISDVLNKPITNEYNIDKQNFNDQREDVSDGSSKRYKSLGERKSFESTDQLMPVSSQATILEKQINLLENIIGSNLDRMATDQKSGSNFDAVSSCSNLSYADSLMVESQNQRATVCESDFIKPTQYEEISEDSSNTKMYEDQKQRKTLNRDEELFLECCSLLKSGSEVSNSNYSKKVETVNKQFDNVMKPEMVNEKLVQGEEDAHEYSDNSRTPTPLGDTYDDEASNSNTISSNWHLNPDPVKHKDKTGINFSDVLGKELRNLSTQIVNTQQEEESDQKNDSDSSSASKKVATKGARKVYEGLKVSIPTEDLNLEVLNGGSLVRKSPPEDVGTPGKTKQARKSKPVKKAQIGSNLLFKVNKKKTPQDTNRPVSEKMFDVFNFEETQDCLPNNESLVKLGNHTDDDSLGYADSIGADAKSVSSGTSMSIISARKQESSPENITKNKYKIMGKIFKNAAKSKADMEEEQRNIPEIPEMDNRELVENYVRSCQDVKSPFLPPPPPPPCDELPKKPKMTEEEMNMLFDQLVGKNSADIQLDKEPLKPPSKPKTSESKKKSSGKVNKGRKRTRVNSGSSDDEFNISSKTRKRAKKKNDQEDSGINLELELKECIGVASRKSQRTCTSGKQNVLVEYWSSDEEEALIESSKGNLKQTQIEETTQTLPIVQAAPPSLHMQPPPAPPKPKPKKKPRKKPKANNDTRSQDMTSQVTVTSNRRKRAAANPLYHWSSSSEDESQSLIEIKPLREEEDDDDDRPVQHGWIVGDSPKKLVTMLALTKGKKNDFDSVKEQGKKRSSNTTS